MYDGSGSRQQCPRSDLRRERDHANLLNKSIAFDNRIPPAGFTYADYAANGAKFYKYQDATRLDGTVGLQPVEDVGRYPDGQKFDEVTYTFTAPTGATLTARAELYWQTHTREFMDHLNQGLNAMAPADKGPRPEAPPSILDPNYPLTPTFLSDVIRDPVTLDPVDFTAMTDLAGNPLQDHWGGVAYAAWIQAGKGAPFLVGSADTTVAAPPAAPTVSAVVNPVDPATGITDSNVQEISWSPNAGAAPEGYVMSGALRHRHRHSFRDGRLGQLAVVFAPQTTLVHEALNPGKTFQYKVQAFNAAGLSGDSNTLAATTPAGALLRPHQHQHHRRQPRVR